MNKYLSLTFFRNVDKEEVFQINNDSVGGSYNSFYHFYRLPEW